MGCGSSGAPQGEGRSSWTSGSKLGSPACVRYGRTLGEDAGAMGEEGISMKLQEKRWPGAVGHSLWGKEPPLEVRLLYLHRVALSSAASVSSCS